MTQPAEPAEPAPVGFRKRNVAAAVLMVTLLVLLALGQWLTIQAGQDVARALRGTPVVGPVDINYKGLSFSREHVLVARYEITGIARVNAAHWYARPWGHVKLNP